MRHRTPVSRSHSSYLHWSRTGLTRCATTDQLLSGARYRPPPLGPKFHVKRNGQRCTRTRAHSRVVSWGVPRRRTGSRWSTQVSPQRLQHSGRVPFTAVELSRPIPVTTQPGRDRVMVGRAMSTERAVSMTANVPLRRPHLVRLGRSVRLPRPDRAGMAGRFAPSIQTRCRPAARRLMVLSVHR
jgi:hypothetical protein